MFDSCRRLCFQGFQHLTYLICTRHLFSHLICLLKAQSGLHLRSVGGFQRLLVFFGMLMPKLIVWLHDSDLAIDKLWICFSLIWFSRLCRCRAACLTASLPHCPVWTSSSLWHHGHALQQDLDSDDRIQRDADFDAWFRCRRQNHHPVPLEAGWGGYYNPNGRIQRWDCGVQEHQIQRVGCGWPRQDSQTLALLLPRHRWSDLCGGQFWPWPNPRCQGRIEQDAARAGDGECCAAGPCQQARLAQCNDCCWSHGEAGTAETSTSEMVHSIHGRSHWRWPLWGFGLAFPKSLLPRARGMMTIDEAWQTSLCTTLQALWPVTYWHLWTPAYLCSLATCEEGLLGTFQIFSMRLLRDYLIVQPGVALGMQGEACSEPWQQFWEVSKRKNMEEPQQP